MKTIQDRTRYETVDENGSRQGLAMRFDFYSGRILEKAMLLNEKLHGEYKGFNSDGSLNEHEYFSNNKIVRNLILEPVDSEEEKLLITLKHGGQWLPNG